MTMGSDCQEVDCLPEWTERGTESVRFGPFWQVNGLLHNRWSRRCQLMGQVLTSEFCQNRLAEGRI